MTEKIDPRLDVLEAAEKICREVADECAMAGRSTGESAALECADQIAGFANTFRPAPQMTALETDEGIAALIRWRDFAAIDWHGEDLVYHIRYHLWQASALDVPIEHRPALVYFKALSEDAQVSRIAHVLNVDLEDLEDSDEVRDLDEGEGCTHHAVNRATDY